MSFSAQGNVKHSRIRAILVRTCYCTNIFPFPPDFHLLPTSPETEKTETLPLKVSSFSLASYGNKLHAGTCSMETFFHGSHARRASSFAPRHSCPQSRDCCSTSSVSGPRRRGYSEKLENEITRKWTGEFLLPAGLPDFWGPTISPASSALPFPK